MFFRRRMSIQTPHNPHDVAALSFDTIGSGQKIIGSEGKLEILGTLNVAVGVNPGALIRVWNNDAAAHFVAFGAAAVAAPTGPADGIPIPAQSYITVNTAEHTHIRSDSALVFGYLLVIDTTLEVTDHY